MRRTLLSAIGAMAILSLAAGGLFADTRTGRDAFRRSDFEAALKDLQPEADKGDAEAIYYLGKMYQGGLGVPKDLKKAGALFARAAEGDNAEAQYEYGVALVLGDGIDQDFVEGVKWLIIAGRINGHAGANEQLDKLPMPREVATVARKSAYDWYTAHGKKLPAREPRGAKKKASH